MNYTTAVHDRVITEYKNYYKNNPNARTESRRLMMENRKYEEQFIKTYGGLCSINSMSSYRRNMSGTDTKLLKSMMGEQYYNYNMVESMACAVDSLLFTIPSEKGSISVGETLRSNITGLKRIGEESAFGYALVGGIRDTKDMFVVKVPRDNDGSFDLLHEYFVGASAINKLRKLVPNFAMIYGAFRGSKPVIDPKTKNVVEWLSPDEDDTNKVPYVIYENIYPSVTADEYLKTCNTNMMKSMIGQVVFAEIIAEKEVCLTHYDLHTGNLLMRKNEGMKEGTIFQIPYTNSSGKTAYIAADATATFIDYGMATICHNGRVIGAQEAEPELYGRYTNRVWPLHDIYKFIMFCALSVLDSNNPNKTEMLKSLTDMFRFFNKEEKIEDVVKTQFDSRYSLMICEETAKYTLTDFKDHLLTKCGYGDVVFTTINPNYPVLECKNCDTVDFISKKVGASKEYSVPNTFYEFYDMSSYLSQYLPNIYEQMKKAFKYENAKTMFINDVRERVDKLNATITIPDISDYGTVSTLETVQQYQIELFDRLATIDSLKDRLKVGAWMAQLYNDYQLDEKMRSLQGIIDNALSDLCTIAAKAEENFDLIYDYIKTNKYKLLARKKKQFKWYSTSARDILFIRDRVCPNIERGRVYEDDTVNLDIEVPSSSISGNTTANQNTKELSNDAKKLTLSVVYDKGVIIPTIKMSTGRSIKNKSVKSPRKDSIKKDFDRDENKKLIKEKYGR